MTIGEKLQLARLNANFTRLQVERYLNIVVHISKARTELIDYEEDEKKIPAKILNYLCELYGIEKRYFSDSEVFKDMTPQEFGQITFGRSGIPLETIAQLNRNMFKA